MTGGHPQLPSKKTGATTRETVRYTFLLGKALAAQGQVNTELALAA